MYPHRVPTQEERETLDPIDITTPHCWSPSDYVNIAPGTANAQFTLSLKEPAALRSIQSFLVMGDPVSQIFPSTKLDKDIPGLETKIHPPEKQVKAFVLQFPKLSDLELTPDPFHLSTAHIKNVARTYDVATFRKESEAQNKVLKPKKSKRIPLDPTAIQPCLGYLPIDVIKRTLDSTTQLAKWHNKVPLQNIGHLDFHL